MSIKLVIHENGTFTAYSDDEIVFINPNLVGFGGASVKKISDDKFTLTAREIPGSKLIWDKPGSRNYENGLDRGVLYLPDKTAVPWNGLTSVIEKFDKSVSSVYFDGMKISDLIELGDFSATLKAVTYPEEFSEIEGLGSIKNGIVLSDQKPKVFSLSYRTNLGNDLSNDPIGYKIHILYNITAIPNEKTYSTISTDPSLAEFEWDLSAIPEEVPGFRPTAHIIINSLDVDPWLLEELEGFLYGSVFAPPYLIPMPELISYIMEWYRVKIIDNGDGTWTAESKRDGFIDLGLDGFFEIENISAVYLDEYTFVISDTSDISEVPLIRIDDNGDGTWSATSNSDALISIVDGVFEIRNANVVYMGIDSYEISDTIQ